MAYEDPQSKLISEFNEAKWQIFRLNNLWIECRRLREHGRLIGVRWRLDSATIELWNDAIRLDKDKKEEEKYTTKLEKLDKEIETCCKNKDFNELYKKLIEKERVLREIQEESGKGARYKSADEELI